MSHQQWKLDRFIATQSSKPLLACLSCFFICFLLFLAFSLTYEFESYVTIEGNVLSVAGENNINNEDIEVRIRLPAEVIGRVSNLQKIKLSMNAYPHGKYGFFDGVIVNRDLIVNGENSFLEVKTSLHPPHDQKRTLASSMEILPGMKCTAYIIIKKQALLKHFFDKFLYQN